MKKKILAIATVLLLQTAQGLASPLDYYHNLLVNNKFTIRYENITPLPRVTNRDKVSIYGKDGMNLNKVAFMTNRQFQGLVVINGSDKYEEVGNGDINLCSLTKGDKVYFFTKANVNGKTVYYGNEGEGKVSASNRNRQAEFVNGSSYADPNLTRMLSALLPASRLPIDLPCYNFIRAGRLPNGLVYEDFYTNNEGTEEAVRYYMDGNAMVKIAAASFRQLPNGKVEGDKVIIRVNEFSGTPDMQYLYLPDGLKDVSKK